MPRAAKKPPVLGGFAEQVALVAAEAPVADICVALGALVKARLRKPVAPTPAPARTTPFLPAKPRAQRRRRSVGKFRRYHATSKLDFSRPGTFRTYMIATIRAHDNTRDANEAHANCNEPSFAKNRLDFNWAADNGYIEFDD